MCSLFHVGETGFDWERKERCFPTSVGPKEVEKCDRGSCQYELVDGGKVGHEGGSAKYEVPLREGEVFGVDEKSGGEGGRGLRPRPPCS